MGKVAMQAKGSMVVSTVRALAALGESNLKRARRTDPPDSPAFHHTLFFNRLNKKRFNRTRFIDSQLTARMAKLADAPDLGSGTARCVGSSPSPGIPFLRTVVTAPLCWGVLFSPEHGSRVPWLQPEHGSRRAVATTCNFPR